MKLVPRYCIPGPGFDKRGTAKERIAVSTPAIDNPLVLTLSSGSTSPFSLTWFIGIVKKGTDTSQVIWKIQTGRSLKRFEVKFFRNDSKLKKILSII